MGYVVYFVSFSGFKVFKTERNVSASKKKDTHSSSECAGVLTKDQDNHCSMPDYLPGKVINSNYEIRL